MPSQDLDRDVRRVVKATEAAVVRAVVFGGSRTAAWDFVERVGVILKALARGMDASEFPNVYHNLITAVRALDE